MPLNRRSFLKSIGAAIGGGLGIGCLKPKKPVRKVYDNHAEHVKVHELWFKNNTACVATYAFNVDGEAVLLQKIQTGSPLSEEYLIKWINDQQFEQNRRT